MGRVLLVLVAVSIVGCGKAGVQFERLVGNVAQCQLATPVAIGNPDLLKHPLSFKNVAFEKTPKSELLPPGGTVTGMVFPIFWEQKPTGFLGSDFYSSLVEHRYPAGMAGLYLGDFEIKGTVAESNGGYEYTTRVIDSNPGKSVSLYARTSATHLEALALVAPVIVLKPINGHKFPMETGEYETLCAQTIEL